MFGLYVASVHHSPIKLVSVLHKLPQLKQSLALTHQDKWCKPGLWNIFGFKAVIQIIQNMNTDYFLEVPSTWKLSNSHSKLLSLSSHKHTQRLLIPLSPLSQQEFFMVVNSIGPLASDIPGFRTRHVSQHFLSFTVFMY